MSNPEEAHLDYGMLTFPLVLMQDVDEEAPGRSWQWNSQVCEEDMHHFDHSENQRSLLCRQNRLQAKWMYECSVLFKRERFETTAWGFWLGLPVSGASRDAVDTYQPLAAHLPCQTKSWKCLRDSAVPLLYGLESAASGCNDQSTVSSADSQTAWKISSLHMHGNSFAVKVALICALCSCRVGMLVSFVVSLRVVDGGAKSALKPRVLLTTMISFLPLFQPSVRKLQWNKSYYKILMLSMLLDACCVKD
eukprot:5901168-Amphidinium_carterae.1